ncbi:chemotaxis protein CheC [Halorhabdus sp. CBA1104]|uniref:chemotaxis protein CheC n=2 Tax=unclassified Halorhabdus TaxID=2621901 RepID=UPI0012B24173|nr:chemotaxis protein CheC [Halorhabdus sp. CBA1104]QGN08219.1 chemotaxis protein CheC [Halorhabdus sp. CBA1104]
MPLLIDIRKLRVINQLIKAGAENAATSLGSLAGVDATVEIKSLSFVEPPDIGAQIGTETVYSASIRLKEPPYGIFLMTFYEETAAEMATLLTGTTVDGEFNQLQQSALQEVCNILTSGFVDGIANTLGTTIDMSTPTLKQACGDELADEMLSHVRVDSVSIVLDSIVDVTDQAEEFKIRLFLIPDPGAFVNLLDHLSVGEIDDDDTEADPVF